MEENSNSTNTFRSVSNSSNFGNFNNKGNNSGGSFSKSVLLPLICGILGAALTIGTCFGVPQIKNKIFGATSPNTSIETSDGNGAEKQINTNLVSLSEYSETGVSVASKVLPSIVGIKVEYEVNSIFYRNSSTATAEGSGVIISSDGYILTNNHIVDTSSASSSNSLDSFYSVETASKITVYLYNDKTEYPATIVGTDSQTDLAVIKIDKTDLTAAELGDSDTVNVGEFSMAIGNPLGMQSSVTAGMISAVNRDVTDSDGTKYTLIQTDAAINSGNSGGALVNSKGQVIGINTLKLSGTGIEGMGFAIPINSTKDIYSQLIQYNKVKRPYIGVTGVDLDEETAKRNNLVVGIYVKSVEEFSAAEKAGVKIGDVIIGVDGTSIKTMDELNDIKNKHQIGDNITLKVNRSGDEKDLVVTLAEQP